LIHHYHNLGNWLDFGLVSNNIGRHILIRVSCKLSTYKAAI